MRKSLALVALRVFVGNVFADGLLEHSRQQLIAGWKDRIQSFLDQGKIPLVDMETTYRSDHVDLYFPQVLGEFDRNAIAITAADGDQAKKNGEKGYRWSDHTLELVNAFPRYFVPTTNGGTSKNWAQGKTGGRSFIAQLEERVGSGKFFVIGEIEFRHFLSNHQCAENKLHRDVSIAIDGGLGDRVLGLSEKYGLPVVIHLDVEDKELERLERALDKHQNAKVVVAHFGQIRQPERQKMFSPEYVVSLFDRFPNLSFDLSNGHPNRKYHCSGSDNDETIVGDNILWFHDGDHQQDHVDERWLRVLEAYSDRFVFATDYGGGRQSLPDHLGERVRNFNLLISNLSDQARHNISYKNAWKLIVGEDWQ
jgi:hypothetical protein